MKTKTVLILRGRAYSKRSTLLNELQADNTYRRVSLRDMYDIGWLNPALDSGVCESMFCRLINEYLDLEYNVIIDDLNATEQSIARIHRAVQHRKDVVVTEKVFKRSQYSLDFAEYPAFFQKTEVAINKLDYEEKVTPYQGSQEEELVHASTSNLPPAVVVSIEHLTKALNKFYDANCELDQAKVDLVKGMWLKGCELIFWSDRSELERSSIEELISANFQSPSSEYRVGNPKYEPTPHVLVLRPDSDRTPSIEFKENVFEKAIVDTYDVKLVFDPAMRFSRLVKFGLTIIS